MSGYSSPSDIKAFLATLGARPCFVNDMDGNTLDGYTLKPGKPLPLGKGNDPKNQSIPFGTSPLQLDLLAATGVLEKGIFAEKPMDARLPPRLVALVNDAIANDNPFAIAFLTSRAAGDALTLLRESGVTAPEKATLIADSGATLRLNGEKTEVRRLSDEERGFLSSLGAKAETFREAAQNVLAAQGFDPAACPGLYIESKGIALNVHYRAVLAAYNQPEGSALDRALGAALKTLLRAETGNGPQSAGAPVFKTLDGPATVEVTAGDINKGHGLEALLRAIKTANAPVTSVVFTGDDVSKGNGTPGTDWFAMIRAPELSETYGIPVRNIHTHHPVGADLAATLPDPAKSPAALSAEWPAPLRDLVVRTPEALGDVIVSALHPATAPPAPQSAPQAKPHPSR